MKNFLTKIISFVKENLVIGLISAGPIFGTIYIVFILLSFLDNAFGQFYEKTIGIKIPGAGIMTGFIIVLLTGLFARTYLARILFGIFENYVSKVPLAGTIYSAFKNIADMFQRNRTGFGKPVIVLTDNLSLIGFEVNREKGNSTVLVPSVPNPTTGFVLVVPEKNIIHLSASADDVMKFLFSFGSYSKPISDLGELERLMKKEEKTR